MTARSALRLVEPPPGRDPAADGGEPATAARASEPERPETAGAQTLRRGLAVLRLLTRVGPGGLRMGEIGHRLGLNKTTAIRLTRTLVDEGFVLHDRAAGRYRLGPEAFAVGLAAEPSYELQRQAAAVLRALAAESGDTVFFTVLHGHESICLSRDEGDFPIRNQLIKPGDRWPLGVGAGSAAILALVRDTRDRGYCLQPGMVFEDSWAVGVVVYDANGAPVASISIAALRSRLGPARSAMLGNRLMQASKELTAQLRV